MFSCPANYTYYENLMSDYNLALLAQGVNIGQSPLIGVQFVEVENIHSHFRSIVAVFPGGNNALVCSPWNLLPKVLYSNKTVIAKEVWGKVKTTFLGSPQSLGISFSYIHASGTLFCPSKSETYLIKLSSQTYIGTYVVKLLYGCTTKLVQSQRRCVIEDPPCNSFLPKAAIWIIY
jgi:hypothetical protein